MLAPGCSYDLSLPRRPYLASAVTRPVITALIAVSLAGGACSSGGVPEVPAGPDGTPDPVLVAGRQVYVERCANCHGDDGGGGRGSELSDGLLIERYPDVAEQVAVVFEGVRGMPAFGEALSVEEIEAVTRFTREVL